MVARLCDVSMPSVSDWKKDGIPRARMMLLRVIRKTELEEIDLDAATSLGHATASKDIEQPAPGLDEAGQADRRETVRRSDDISKDAELEALKAAKGPTA